MPRTATRDLNIDRLAAKRSPVPRRAFQQRGRGVTERRQSTAHAEPPYIAGVRIVINIESLSPAVWTNFAIPDNAFGSLITIDFAGISAPFNEFIES